MRYLDGKIAIVTGGSRGIGAGISRRLAEAGVRVALTYRDNGSAATSVLTEIRKLGGEAIAVQADASDAVAIAKAVGETVERYGGLDILINNNGTVSQGFHGLQDAPVAVIDEVINVNLRSSVLYSRSAIPHMRNNGRIINIGTSLSRRLPAAGLTLYATSKAGIAGLTKGLARDLGSRGITVNQVSPGPINTEMNPEDGPAAAFQRALTVFDRYGKPGEIASLIMFLVSEEAAYITGADIPVDGGTTI